MVQKKNTNKLTCFLMKMGNKNKSENTFINIIKILKKKKKKNIYSIFKLALKNASNITNVLTLKKKKRKPVYIPFFIKKSNRLNTAIKNIIISSRSSSGSGITNNFVLELLDISSNKGGIKKNIKNIHLKSFMNKNFAHYRWF